MRKTSKSKLRGRKAIPVIGYLNVLLARPALFYSGLGAILLLLSLTYFQSSDKLSIKAWGIFSPIVTTVSKPFVAVSSVAGNVTSYQKLQVDYELLKEENARLLEWYHASQLLQAENKSLKSLLNIDFISTKSFLTAKSIADFSSPYAQSLLLDIGEVDGVKVGQAVIAEKGLLGRIVDTEDSISRVLLLNDINSRIPVVIDGTSQKAIIAGRNNDLPRLEYIPEDVDLEVGIRIVTSGDGGLFPEGLPVGRINSVDKDHITVELDVDKSSIDFVRVFEPTEKQ